jgi:hypothetical protein
MFRSLLNLKKLENNHFAISGENFQATCRGSDSLHPLQSFQWSQCAPINVPQSGGKVHDVG